MTFDISYNKTSDLVLRFYLRYHHHHHHHHHRVASPSMSIAVSTSWRHFKRSCARIHAVLRPRLWRWRSSSILRSHVRLGRLARRRQSLISIFTNSHGVKKGIRLPIRLYVSRHDYWKMVEAMGRQIWCTVTDFGCKTSTSRLHKQGGKVYVTVSQFALAVRQTQW